MSAGTQAALRFTAGGCAIAVLALALATIREPQGWLVAGHSMAPTLQGIGLAWNCPECKIGFSTEPAEYATCPNCGARRIPMRYASATSPMRCYTSPPRSRFHHATGSTDSLAHANGASTRPVARLPIRRWDMVAFRANNSNMIKRVYGLPGESIALRQGDVWINGQRLQKSLSEFRRTAILVHDSNFLPTESSRWTATPADAWRRTEAGWTSAHGGALRYIHRYSFDSPQRRDSPSKVYDHYAFNAELSRQLTLMNDVVIDVRLRLRNVSRLQLTTQQPNFAANLTLAPDADERQWAVSADGSAETAHLPSGWFTLTFGATDRRAFLAVDQRTVWSTEQREESLTTPKIPAGFEMQLAYAGGRQKTATCQIQSIKIWRDLHLAAMPRGTNQWTLAADEWFVLGDNVPQSLDSRQIGVISKSMLLGRVLRTDGLALHDPLNRPH